MKWVVTGLTVWNFACPGVALGAYLVVSTLGWDSAPGAAAGFLNIIAAALFFIGTPLSAGFVIYRQSGLLRWLNILALIAWLLGVLRLVAATYH
ncbi:MAG: hypothetical protein H6741_09470 [Alphaproteobacteria bacterium]|nr:hypothetical protein [Alphaproteobacteria bacterium]MCB9792943.1 hypothetical protein [Alphaproteobacteria bacterium]